MILGEGRVESESVKKVGDLSQAVGGYCGIEEAVRNAEDGIRTEHRGMQWAGGMGARVCLCWRGQCSMSGELEILKFGAKVLGVAAGGNLNGHGSCDSTGRQRATLTSKSPLLPPLMAATRLHHEICMENFTSLSLHSGPTKKSK